ncbi:uncharacterized protein STEHIDRAFT_70029 [Stereum hirsutum FP-91666 SS1]|uniref:Uncharacterized protein n=1 Tax=Stereum hirsutum (strain FP-91666) TaxID=721885 RepID=R7RW54_STEHR|nr:uncharacterized protein STEHIDRAFT_48836 [Stereum hirsutum FP-91666 SS1]XP_007311898.1 uncharacterized protein STEHIDRAFT_70029 [Stereum hirsutum FP-91666 SS1]EIM79005.1 hypothetical protein STEHIDRAFT_70029 [Stereum hirsutum FP-91666 SS1]EIM91209.1 hypothetical protein STEHIDRAFT_48836 [Stereum hirsutum FP-91666 SS1]
MSNADWGTAKKPNDHCWRLIRELEKRENAKVIYGLRPGEVCTKSSGETKITVCQRMAKALWPNCTDLVRAGQQVKTKCESLAKVYREKSKGIKETGGGLEGHEQGTEVLMEFYVPAHGPDHDTPEKYTDLWSMFTCLFYAYITSDCTLNS